MGAPIIPGGEVAHDDEQAAIAFLAQGLPSSATVFSNPTLATPQGALYELDVVVALSHAIFIVEIKSFHGQVRAGLRDWTLNDGRTRRSPLLLGRKTAQVLHSALARRSYEAGRAWVQELTFLPNVSRVDGNPAVTSRIATRDTLHAMLLDPERIQGWSTRYTQSAVTDPVVSELMSLLNLSHRPTRVRRLAHFAVVDTLDTNERYTEYLGTADDGISHRILRHYRRPWGATEERWAALKKRALWEAGILQSLDRAPPELGLPRVEAVPTTSEDVVVPIEHFQGLSLPEWVERHGKDLALSARIALWMRIARTVAYLHSRGIIHRHLSGGLVLVAPDNTDAPDFRVTGFDLAKREASDTTIASSGVSADRLEGAAPEVVHALSDGEPRSDQFSLGILLALLVLNEPLVASTLPYLEGNKRLPTLRERKDNQSERLDAAVATMLAKRPTDRFRTLDEAMAAVATATAPPTPTHVDPLAPGNAMGSDYIIVSKLGSGGLSDVYKVKHRLLPQSRAFKVARNNPTAELALRREHAALSLFDHPQVVRAHDLTRMVADRITLVLDFIEGRTLTDHAPTIAEGDTHTRRRLAEDLFTALDVFEQMDLSHNDLKPDNLMVTPHGRLVTIDLSLADGPSLKDHEKAPLGGTQKWRDPATQRGHAADRYAASMCLFWLHAGRHPFDGTVPEPDTAPDIHPEDLDPPGLASFFTTAMHPEPTERYASAASLRDGYLTALGAAVPGMDAVTAADLSTTTPLSQTALPARAVRCLAAARVRTVGHLLSLDDAEVRRVHGLGSAMATHVSAFAQRARRADISPQPIDTVETAPPFFAALTTQVTPLAALPLDPSLISALSAAKLATVGAVARSTRAELLAIAGVGKKALTQLGQALVDVASEQDTGAVVMNTLDGIWDAATRDLSDDDRALLAQYLGLNGTRYATQNELAAATGLTPAQVSQSKTRALDGLNRDALKPLIDEVHSLLDNQKGIAVVSDAAVTLVRQLPTAVLDPIGALTLVCTLDRESFAIYDDVDIDVPCVLVRPKWFTRDTLRTFLNSTHVIASWPPTNLRSARASLKMVLPDYQDDPIPLAERLNPQFCRTHDGDVFSPPVTLTDAVTYALAREPAAVPLHTLSARLTAVFGIHAPSVPDAVSLADTLDSATKPACPFTVIEDEVVRRDGVRRAPDAFTTPDIKAVLALAEHESEDEAVTRRLLGAVTSGAAFRLVVAAPAQDVAIGTSLIAALSPHTEVVGIDLADAWFSRHADTLSRDARAHYLAPLRKVTATLMNRLFDELVAEYGAPGRTLVLYRTGLLATLGALEEIRLLYTRVSGGHHGLWVLVIPGTVNDVSTGQPLFNGVEGTWRLDGQVLPLNRPIATTASSNAP